jgi:Domain of unknown function (DUF4190)
MKKISLVLILVSLVLGSCTRNNYVSNIPKQKFDYQESTPKTQIVTDAEISFTETKQTVSEVIIEKERANVVAEKVSPEVSLASSNSKNIKKLTFKQRLVKKIVESKIKKVDAMKASPKSLEDGTNGLALTSGILGIFAIIGLLLSTIPALAIFGTLSILAAIAAIVFGFISKSQIKAGKGSGLGWAITGIVLGIVHIFFIILAVTLIVSLSSTGGI